MQDSTVTAVVGLGSNLGDPVAQLQRAVDALRRLPASRLGRCSRLYRNPPMGPQDQPHYVNAVLCLHTRLAAHSLLTELQAIELCQGRRRGADRWGPRTLDLDLLLYGDAVIDSERLRVPHPGMAGRDFVLLPLAEVMPDAVLPGLGPLRALLERLPPARLQPVSR